MVIELTHYIFILFAFIIYIPLPSILTWIPKMGLAIWLGVVIGFLSDDFSTLLISKFSNSEQSIGFKMASIWKSYEGSLFLWITFIWLLSKYVKFPSSSFYLRFNKLCFWIIEILSNPFLKQCHSTLEGNEINPLLQDSFLMIHPPILYLGNASLFFCFVLGWHYLKSGDFDLLQLRRWNWFSWICLTAGIGLGSWWAYHELGWGGYWFWDPVEILALIPWMLTLICIHLLKIQTTQFQVSTLNIFSFLITFIASLAIRTGILSSLHNFMKDLNRILYLGIPLILFFIYFSYFYVTKFEKFNSLLIYVTSKSLLIWSWKLTTLLISLLLISVILPLLFNQNHVFGEVFYTQTLFPLFCLLFVLFYLLYLIPSTYAPLHYEFIGFSLGYALCFFTTIFSITTSSYLLFLCSVYIVAKFRYFRHFKNLYMTLSHLGIVILLSFLCLNSWLKQDYYFCLKRGDTLSINMHTFYFFQIEEFKQNFQFFLRCHFNFSSPLLHNLGDLTPDLIYDTSSSFLKSKLDIISNGIFEYKILLHDFAQDGTLLFQIGFEPFLSCFWLLLFSLLLLSFWVLFYF